MSTIEATTSQRSGSQGRELDEGRLERLRHVIGHAGHLLPSQGPITVFVHHNTLHAFEDLPFDEAVQSGGRIFGCEPYLSEERYREALGRGRIRPVDLETVLRHDLNSRGDEPILSLCTRFELRLAMLRHSIQTGPAAELRWFVAETDALDRIREDAPSAVRERLLTDTHRRAMHDFTEMDGGAGERTGSDEFRDLVDDLRPRFGDLAKADWSDCSWEAFTLRALWRVCREGARGLKPVAATPPAIVRSRDLLLEATGRDTDLLVNDVLTRYCAAYLDQGLAHGVLPDRECGFYQAFCTVHRQPAGPPERWQIGLAQELARLQDGGIGPLACIAESLDRLGVREEQWDRFLSETLLALRGWAGMFQQVEERNDRVVHPIAPGSLVEYLAVRLVLERFAANDVAREELGYAGPLAELPKTVERRLPPHRSTSPEQRAFVVFQLAQLFGWTPHELHGLSRRGWASLVEEIESFPNVERRRVFHAAYERRYLNQILDAMSVHGRRDRQPVAVPQFQVFCCIDDREESFRRHLEEVAPDVETFGTAGFYNIAMYYRGAADAHFVPLCPAVVTPKHWVEERVVEATESNHQRRTKARRVVGAVSHWIHVASRSFAWGAVLSAGAGVVATVPLVSRVLFPRLAAGVRRRLGGHVQPASKTRLTLERAGAEPSPDEGGLGYSLDEMIGIAETVLRDVGLTEETLARLVLVLGHGSHSMNNPHEAAHDCGACGGAVGGPNGRAFAQIANNPRVRERLAARGLRVPEDTVFVGGLHNTCNEYVKFYDTDRVPASHREEFEAARGAIERALDRDAHERARRFDSAPLSISFEEARAQMDARAEDLAQVRPEWGHATNAVTIVGRRSRTRGLFFDRRAFLTSYDPTQDDADAAILARTLAAVVPVCAGIGLEYYFSHVDPYGYGCSTKLPHNVAALLGVMDGAASDLRTGLPWQMVEIHEPLRQLFVVETTPEAMRRVLDRSPSIDRLCRNGWIHLAILSPDSNDVQVFRDGRFHPYVPETTELPKARSSVDWYRGWRDFLDVAAIEA
ncbi:MAG: DUF2309 domain-containing protein [Planctomycetaceae bacterium]